MVKIVLVGAGSLQFGTGMLGGIIFSAVIGIVMVPVFYVAVIKTSGMFRTASESKT